MQVLQKLFLIRLKSIYRLWVLFLICLKIIYHASQIFHKIAGLCRNATTLRQERISSKVRLQHSVHLYRVRTIEAIQLVRFTFHFMINICKLRRTLYRNDSIRYIECHI